MVRIIGLLAAAALLLTGCGADHPAPKVPKQSASATPTATPPTMPPQARKDSEAGAIAFAKHYIDVFNYASNTGDVKELQRLSDPRCEGCTSYIRLFKGTYQSGGYYRGSDWTIRRIEVRVEGKYSMILAKMSAPAGTFKSSSKDTVHASRAENTVLALLPVRSSDRWRLYSFERNEAAS